jgi:OOP family OmpA-OmpF porin
MKTPLCLLIAAALLAGPCAAADLVRAKDPEGVKRYEDSVLIAHQAPKYDEYFAAKDKQRDFGKKNPFGPNALRLEGHVERWSYLAPTVNRSSLEVFKNYRDEFMRLDLEIVHAPAAGEAGWIGPTYDSYADKAGLGQILSYNEAEEHYLIAKSQDTQPTYYVLFVTAYGDGVIPGRLENVVKKKMPLVQLDIIRPTAMEEKMVFVKAEEMKAGLEKSGHVALYGLLFDTDKDTLKNESLPSLEEVAKLLKNNPTLKLYVVGHTDNQGSAEYNLDLSQRRSKSIVKALISQYGIDAKRLYGHGAGLFSPVASNSSEEGRSKNRRVELVEQ